MVALRDSVALRVVVAGVWALAALVLSPAKAQDGSNLAQEAQNPITNLITVPFQNNTNFGNLNPSFFLAKRVSPSLMIGAGRPGAVIMMKVRNV